MPAAAEVAVPRTSAPIFSALPPARRLPVVPIVVGLIVIAGAAFAWMKLKGGGNGSATPPDTAAHAVAPTPNAPRPTPPDSTPAAPATPAMGFVRLLGDLPDEFTFLADGTEQPVSRVYTLAPGPHTIELQSEEFQPWEGRITVKAGDTTKVRIELELKNDSAAADSTQNE